MHAVGATAGRRRCRLALAPAGRVKDAVEVGRLERLTLAAAAGQGRPRVRRRRRCRRRRRGRQGRRSGGARRRRRRAWLRVVHRRRRLEQGRARLLAVDDLGDERPGHRVREDGPVGRVDRARHAELAEVERRPAKPGRLDRDGRRRGLRQRGQAVRPQRAVLAAERREGLEFLREARGRGGAQTGGQDDIQAGEGSRRGLGWETHGE